MFYFDSESVRVYIHQDEDVTQNRYNPEAITKMIRCFNHDSMKPMLVNVQRNNLVQNTA